MDVLILNDTIILVILFFFSGFFSASETALMGLGRSRLAHAIEKGGAQGRALECWKNDPNKLLTTILIMNNMVNITATTVAAFLAVHISEILQYSRGQMGALVAAVVTVVIIIFGEVTPKVLAIHKSEKIALLVIRPLVLLAKILHPLSRFLVFIASIFLRPFGLKPGSSIPMVTEEEIHALIKIGADEGVLEDQEHQMIHGVISLGETQVREVMVPRTEMECVNADHSMDRIINQIVQAGYSRMPVYKGSVDNLVGVVYSKDVISVLQNKELIVLQDILRIPYFVPETKKVDELLHEFQRGKLHLAVVVDEYGGTSGLVTLEDLIEEIVGEIRDEYDVEEKNIEKTEDKTWLVNAQTDIKEINDVLEIELPDMKDLNTIGGFVINLLGHLPKKGEQIIHQNLHFTIIAASSHKIDKIQIRMLDKPIDTPAAEA
ncbi:HlyC/CorC family transporter [bacterium]|nr:HlyC/CorC family transporter [bacterium]